MIVLRSTYDALAEKLKEEKSAHERLKTQWNEIIATINAKGGRDFLNGPSFSKDEIRTLAVLCHPDKHGPNSKPKAEEITRKLLSLR